MIADGSYLTTRCLQTLLGAIGGGDEDGDVELSEAISEEAVHANTGSGGRQVYLRSMQRLYERGGVILDHENSERIGDPGYVTNFLMGTHGFTRRAAWAVCAVGSLRRWQALPAPAQNALLAHFVGPWHGWRNIARGLNPVIS